MYEVYYNKQAPRNITESPNTQITMGTSPEYDTNVQTSSLVGYGIAGGIALNAVNRVIDTSLSASGNVTAQIRLAQARQVGGGLLRFVGIAKLANPLVAIGTEIVNFTLKRYEQDVEEQIAKIDNQYNIQKQGVAIKQFAGGGVRYD
jgi:hypothetical protein